MLVIVGCGTVRNIRYMPLTVNCLIGNRSPIGKDHLNDFDTAFQDMDMSPVGLRQSAHCPIGSEASNVTVNSHGPIVNSILNELCSCALECYKVILS